jgi:imidazolonepropionase-like amidohydrolase
VKHFIKCGKLFTGNSIMAGGSGDQYLVIEDDSITHAGPLPQVAQPAPGDTITDYSRYFVAPGLIDIHVHLSYGNAKTEEDIDLYAPVEFRALRGMEAAQRVLLAGYTSIADPATTGLVTPSIRDAVEAGLFVGPRITSSGRQITARQGLSDWYPRWIGVPSTSIGSLVRNAAEGVEEIRCQIKDGVDFIKLAMDGDAMNPSTGLISGFTQDETTAMVSEAHRLGRKVVTHARGAEAVRYAAKAGADVILHASWMDDEGLEYVVKNGCYICPTLSLVVNDIDFTQVTDGCYPDFPDAHKRELESACKVLPKAKAAGVPFMVGSDAGFAVTPYGEWHARELEHFVRYLGFSPEEAMRCTTKVNAEAGLLRNGAKTGVLQAGRLADFIVIDGDPLQDIEILQDKSRLKAIYLGGKKVDLELNPNAKRLRSEFSYQMWNQVYTQERINELMPRKQRRAV